MENLKIRVNNEAESKEVQELFFELGYKWFSGGNQVQHLKQSCSSSFGYLVAWSTGCFTNVIQCGCGGEDAKEITIPQLKDMVVLKRNDVGDATHGNLGGQKGYLTCENVEYFWNYFEKKWNKISLTFIGQGLKPITKEPTMREFLVKSQDGKWRLETEVVGDPGDDIIEVPHGADKAFQAFSNAPVVFKRSECGYSNAVIIWQRETLNDKVASAEVARQSGMFVGTPFSDLPAFNFGAIDDFVESNVEQDNVNQPSHYCSHPSGIECIEITRHHDFAIGNAIKYLWRAGLKDSANEIQDLEKASWYIQDKINQLKKINGQKAK